MTQSCSENGMEFTLRTPEAFRGRIYTYKHFDRPGCSLLGDGGRVHVLRIPGPNGIPNCGTESVRNYIHLADFFHPIQSKIFFAVRKHPDQYCGRTTFRHCTNVTRHYLQLDLHTSAAGRFCCLEWLHWCWVSERLRG